MMWPIEERRMSELETLGTCRVWGWQHQLEDTYTFEQVRIPLLAVSFLISSLGADCHYCLNQWGDSH